MHRPPAVRLLALTIVLLLVSGVGVGGARTARDARQDLASVDQGVHAQLGEVRDQVTLTAGLLGTAQQLDRRAARLVELAEQLAGTAGGTDAAVQQLLELAGELVARARVVERTVVELEGHAEVLVGETIQATDLAEQQLRVSRDVEAVLRRSLQVQEATLQEIRELNDKVPPPTGGSGAVPVGGGPATTVGG